MDEGECEEAAGDESVGMGVFWHRVESEVRDLRGYELRVTLFPRHADDGEEDAFSYTSKCMHFLLNGKFKYSERRSSVGVAKVKKLVAFWSSVWMVRCLQFVSDLMTFPLYIKLTCSFVALFIVFPYDAEGDCIHSFRFNRLVARPLHPHHILRAQINRVAFELARILHRDLPALAALRDFQHNRVSFTPA